MVQGILGSQREVIFTYTFRGEKDNQDPQSLLETLNLQLRGKSGREVEVQVTPRTYERKKKRVKNELKRLTLSINYGKTKEGKGMSLKL